MFIGAFDEESPWSPGGASRWWLHHSLVRLSAALEGVGSRLVVRLGPTLDALRALIQDTGATAVYWTRLHEPTVVARDQRVRVALTADGIRAYGFGGALLVESSDVLNRSGRPFQVFTPFWKHVAACADPAAPIAAPREIPAPRRWPRSLPLAALRLEDHVIGPPRCAPPGGRAKRARRPPSPGSAGGTPRVGCQGVVELSLGVSMVGLF